jgi:hypothetical protein
MKVVALIVLAVGLYVIDETYAGGRNTTAALVSFKEKVRVINRRTDDLMKLLKGEPG